MKTVSRREFLKGAALSAAGLAAAGLLAGCSSENKDASQQPAPTEAPAASDWLGKAPEFKESDFVKTYETDVLVIGAGNGGLFAASAAVEEGAKTILIEKFSEEFGGSGIRDTLGAINSKQQIANNDNPDRLEVITELYRVSNGYGDMRL